MFYYISGTLVHKGDGFAVIDASGVGYKIHTSRYSLDALGEPDSKAKMYTYLYVRDDVLDIYGFFSADEMRLFEMLISVSGVGPKVALSLLSGMPPQRIAEAIAAGDAKTLTIAQGIGPKVAQRVVLELKDKLKNEAFGGDAGADAPDRAGFGRAGEAVEALMGLGYSQAEARRAISGIDTNTDLELIVKAALKKLVK